MPIVTTSRRSKRKSSDLPLIVIAVIIVLAGGIYLVIRNTDKNSNPEIETSTSNTSQVATGDNENDSNLKKRAVVGETYELPAKTQKEISQEQSQADKTSETGTVSEPATQKEENKPKPMPYGVLSKKYFDNPVEDRLEKLGIPGQGVAMSLPNRLTNEQVMEILKRPIQINEDDDEETVAAKERTAAMKTEALKYIEEGGTYDEFVAEMTKISNEEFELKKNARVELMRILKTEGYEAAEAYLEEVNPTLKEAGLKEMKIPLPFRVKHQKELERATKGN